MNTSRKKKAFRPGGYDALEERVVLSTRGAIAERLRDAGELVGERLTGRRQLATRPLGLRAELGRRQFPLRGGANGVGGGANNLGFSPLVTALGFRNPAISDAALTATNTVSSVVGPNFTANPNDFDDPNFSVDTLAQSLVAGVNTNNLGLNSGRTNFLGRGLGTGFFSNGLGFINAQSVVGNLANRINPSLNITADQLNRGLVSFGGLGANNRTFGLANALRNFNQIGFNGGLGLNNGLGFSNNPTTPSLGRPLTSRLGFDVLGLNRQTRGTFGLTDGSTDPIPDPGDGSSPVPDPGEDTDPVPQPGEGTGTGTGTGGTTGGTGTVGTGTGSFTGIG